MTRRIKKYAKGTGPLGYIPSPNEAIAKNDIVLARAQAKADSNVWANTVIPMASSLLQSMATKGKGGKGPTIDDSSMEDSLKIGDTTMDYTAPNDGASDMGLKGDAGILNYDTFLEGNYQESYAALGKTSAEGEIEAEGGEVIQTPEGETATLEGPKHEAGGIPLSTEGDPNAVNIPEGTQIFSDRVKGTDGKTMATRKELRDKKRASIEDLLSKNPTDKLRVNAYTKTLKNLEIEETQDLDVQEKASMMAELLNLDGVNEFAYGTGRRGVKKYAGGTGPNGVDPELKPWQLPYSTKADAPIAEDNFSSLKYYDKLSSNEFGPYLKQYMKEVGDNTLDWKSPDTIKGYQKYIGLEGDQVDGKLGSISLANSIGTFKKSPVSTNTEAAPTKNKVDFLDSDGDGVPDSIDIDSMNPAVDPVLKTTDTEGISETSTTSKPSSSTPSINGGEDSALNRVGEGVMDTLSNVSLGDAITLAGTYASATDPLKNVNENRAGDQPNVNHFRNFGKEGIAKIQEQKGYVEGQKAEALMRTTRTASASKKAMRNSARGVNTMRALDLASDMTKNSAESDIYSNFAQQMMQITGAEAQMENAQDEAVMGGEQARDLADRQDRDNYYTQRGLALANRGTGIQQMGKNINEIKMNQMKLKLLESLGEYVTMDANGNIIAKNQKTAKK